MFGHSESKYFNKVEFYDLNNVLLLRAGCEEGNVTNEFTLDDNERLIGVKSKRVGNANA